MAYQPHFIAQYDDDSGLNTYYEPFIIPERAFPILEDAYCWRGRVKNRDGFKLLGRLRRNLASTTLTNQAVGAAYNVADVFSDAAIGLRSTEANAEIQPTTVSVTVGAITFTDPAGDGILVGAPAANSGTINYITGELNLSFNPALGAPTNVDITFFYYPALPVMGIRRLENPAKSNINDERTIVFDMKYAYEYSTALLAYRELPSTAPTTWQGSNSDFFWTTNYQGFFFATNFNDGGITNDPLRSYDGLTWATYQPTLDGAGKKLLTCLCIVPYKDRLLAFNTWEGAVGSGVNFAQRLRYSQNGTVNLTTDANAWRSDIIGKGGFVTIPTGESIVSVEFIKDILVVKCERSSWKCVYTGNEVLPFVFQKINTELGAESTFSLVPFDSGIFSVGNVGITTDDGVNVVRIDQQIPQYVFNFNNDFQGVTRVHGIRDYFRELVLWCYPDQKTNAKFPNKVLCYNYRNNSYSVFNDSFTCFGYFQRQADLRWIDLTISWESYEEIWGSGATQSLFPSILAGNQQGYVEELFQKTDNDVYLSITATDNPNNWIIVPNNTFQDGDIISISGIIGVGPDAMNGFSYRVTILDPVAHQERVSLEQFDGTAFNTFTVPAGTYLGGGKITFLQGINIQTKVFSPFYEESGQCRLGYVDFFLDRTDSGQLTSNIFVDENDNTVINDPLLSTNSGLIGSNILLTSPENISLIPSQQFQNKIWHRIFVESICQNFQIEITKTDEQRADVTNNSARFVMHAMAFYLTKNARLTQ